MLMQISRLAKRMRAKILSRVLRGGFTLVEVMVSVAIAGVTYMGTAKAFNYITKAVGGPRSRVVAINLVKEKLETLKNYSYYRLTPTPAAALANPNDTSNPFPPEILTVDNQDFTRYATVIKLNESSGALVTLSAGDLEQNIKKLEVWVTWVEDQNTISLTLFSILNNISPVDRPGRIEGIVTDASSGAALTSVRLEIDQDPSWMDVTTSTGFYSIAVNLASWTVTAERRGYSPTTTSSLIVSDANVVTKNIMLSEIPTGTISGTVYKPAGAGVQKDTVMSANDGVSAGTQADNSGLFAIPFVAAGTHTLMAVYGTGYAEKTFTVIAGATTIVNMTLVAAARTVGVFSGTVQKGSTNLSGIIVEADEHETITNVSGKYYLLLPSDQYNMVANPDGLNSGYTEDDPDDELTLAVGADVTQNFTVKATGKVSGKITTNGTEPLPGVIVVASQFGEEIDAAVSDSSGNYTVTVPGATESYLLTPALDTKETSSPVSVTQTVNDGDNLTGKNFTVSTVSGKIQGTVTLSGTAITTGVMILASTTLIADPLSLPDINSSFSSSSVIYYSTTTEGDGNYTLYVRRGQIYHLYAIYGTVTETATSSSYKSLTNVSMTSTGSLTGKNFAFP